MKSKNQRELEKYWADQATKKAKLAKKKVPQEQPAAADEKSTKNTGKKKDENSAM